MAGTESQIHTDRILMVLSRIDSQLEKNNQLLQNILDTLNELEDE